MPDIICKWEILLTSLSILKSCFYSLLFLSLVLFYFKKYFGTWGKLFIRVLQQSSCMMPLKATCKILTIKLILKVLLNHFLILLDLLKLPRVSVSSCFLLVPLFSVLTDTQVPYCIGFLIFIPLKAITWYVNNISSLDFLLVLLHKCISFPDLQGFSTFNSYSGLYQSHVKEKQEIFLIIYQDFRIYLN